MEKELLNSEKQLLLVDLCGRLPYDVKCKIEMWKGYDICTIFNINSIGYVEILEDSDTNGVNIENMMNKSRGQYAYTIFDIEGNISDVTFEKLQSMSEVLKVRKVK